MENCRKCEQLWNAGLCRYCAEHDHALMPLLEEDPFRNLRGPALIEQRRLQAKEASDVARAKRRNERKAERLRELERNKIDRLLS